MKSTLRETSAGRRCVAATLVFALGGFALAACGSSGGGSPVTPPPANDSKTTPQPGSIVGNWVLDSIQVLKDTGEVHTLRKGMNLRISPTEVEVLLEEYIGPGSLLPTVMSNFYGTELVVEQQQDNSSGFDLVMTLDFSPIFNLPKGSFLTLISVKGTLVGSDLKVDFLQQEMLDLGSGLAETGRDELQLTFVPGTTVQALSGTWRISEKGLFVLVDSAPQAEILLPIPIPRRVKVGDFLVNSKDRVLGLFGGPFDADDFKNAFPEFSTRLHMSAVGNSVVQGFLAFDGKPGTSSAAMSGVGDFTFFHTGAELQGDLKMVWFSGAQTHAYHIYLILEKVVNQSNPSEEDPGGLQAQIAREHRSFLLPQPEEFYARLFWATPRNK